MTRADILKSLAPGFLPLIIFIVADSLWGTQVGLIVAIGTGMIELAYSYIKEKTLDRFILLDIGLIVVLGGVSIILDNPIFFKLKPALIELIFCIILGISVFSPVNLMLLVSRRYLKNIDLDPGQVKQMNRSLKSLFFLFLSHTLLIIYAAFWLSKGAWAFISGGLFYILFAFYFVFEFARKRLKARDWPEKYRHEEWFDIVDPKGEKIGEAPRSLCHSGPGRLHPVVHLHVIDEDGRLFLQKRSVKKEIQPGKWDTAVGGHVSRGETIGQALQREAQEELGLGQYTIVPLAQYVWETDIESELVYMFVTRYPRAIAVHNPEEIEDGKFWRLKKIKESLGKGIFTPNFEFEFPILLSTVFK